MAVQSCCASFCLTLHAQLAFFGASPIALALHHLHVATKDSPALPLAKAERFSTCLFRPIPWSCMSPLRIRSRKPSLDRLQRPWVSLVEHDGDKLARSLQLLVTSSYWLWRSDTASPCFLCIGKRDVMQLFPNGSVQSLDAHYRGFAELTEESELRALSLPTISLLY